ncbi:MAG: serine/threonine protein kinase [Candidatus Scalinduaceae bacterium]
MYKIKDYIFSSFKVDADLHKSNYAVLDNDPRLGIKYNPNLDFEDEYCVLLQLNHKQIPRAYEYGRNALFKGENFVLTQHYIVLDHMSNIDFVGYFKEKTNQNSIDQLEDIIKCFISVCDPLDYLHSKNYLHCDIKPGHLMLKPNTCTVYLIDYELAIKKAGLIKGISRDYASPEQEALLKDLRNPPEGVPPEAIAFFLSLDDRSDIYSLGAVIYETLTNKKWKEVKTTPRKLNELIPQKLEDIIMATLEEDPTNRISTAKELKQTLEKIL